MERLVAFLQRRGVGGPQALESAFEAADRKKAKVGVPLSSISEHSER